MKAILCLAVAVFAVAAVGAESSVCSTLPIPDGVRCLIDPCSYTRCMAGFTCCSYYSDGCNAVCLADQVEEPKPEFQCPVFEVNSSVRCFANPCQVNTCAPHQTCCADYSKGCNFHCLPEEPEVVAPAPADPDC